MDSEAVKSAVNGAISSLFMTYLSANELEDVSPAGSADVLPNKEVRVTIVIKSKKAQTDVQRWVGIAKNKGEAATLAKKQMLQSLPTIWEAFMNEISRVEYLAEGEKLEKVSEDAFNEFKGCTDVDKKMPFDDLRTFFTYEGIREYRNVGVYICAFLNHTETYLPSTIHFGVHDDGIIQGVQTNIGERDDIHKLFDQLLKDFDPTIDRSLVTLHWKPVHVKGQGISSPSSGGSKKDLHVLVIHVSPDAQRRLFWFKNDCYYRKQGSVTKMPPGLIRERLQNRFLQKVQSSVQ
jgi:hypothetical protein